MLLTGGMTGFPYEGVTLLILKIVYPPAETFPPGAEAFYRRAEETVRRVAEKSLFPRLCRAYAENPDPKKRFTTRPAVLTFQVCPTDAAPGETGSVRERSLVYACGRERRVWLCVRDVWSGEGWLLPQRKQKAARAHRRAAKKSRKEKQL